MDNQIEEAARILNNGGIVMFPTDTVYGIGCRFDDQKAIDRIYQIKGTPKVQSFPHLISSVNQVERLASINASARDLIEKHWPGGLTIILEGKNDKQKIGFRMPDSKLTRTLIDRVGVPVIGTSANFHSQSSPTSYEELDPKLINLVDFVIKGKCEKGAESTVIDTTVSPPKILRRGAVLLIY